MTNYEKYERIDNTFFTGAHTTELSKKLLGKLFVHKVGEKIYSGIINETEAYTQDDPASHSHLGKVSERNWSMFEAPGHIYVYKIYGIYHCLNISTGPKGYGAGILLRSVIPVDGVEYMKENREKSDEKGLTDGPGKLCIAFEIDRSQNGLFLGDNTCPIQLYHIGYEVPKFGETPRIGITKGKDLLWRYVF